MAEAGPRILVFGDSLCFHGPDGSHAADDPRLWPNIAAQALGGSAVLAAGFGWTARDAWWSLIGDPRVWADVPSVDAVVFAVGSMDTLPSPLPTYLRTGLRYLRPDWLRRTARAMYLRAQPRLSIAMRGRPRALPARLSVHYLDTAVGALRVLRPELPIIGILPMVHQAASYGYTHTGLRPATAAISEWGRRARVPLVDLPGVVGEHVRSGLGNPDGMHWGWEGHRLAGAAMADMLAPLLAAQTRAPTAPSPDATWPLR